MAYFLHDFWRKLFLTLYFISWPNLIAWQSLLLEILGIMCIVITCWPVFNVINFEINHRIPIKPFFCITKKSRRKHKYLRNKKSCSKWNKKYILSFLKGFHCQKLYQTWEWALNYCIKRHITSWENSCRCRLYLPIYYIHLSNVINNLAPALRQLQSRSNVEATTFAFCRCWDSRGIFRTLPKSAVHKNS